MWNNKRTEEESAPKAAPRPLPASEPAVRPAPTPATTAEQPKQPSRGGVIGSSMTVKGEVHSREELYVDGEIQGSIELQHRLTIGPNGKVNATVKAREVVVHGVIQGNVQAVEKIILREKASLVGDIKTAGIVIEDGAYFKGSIDITRAEASPKPAKAQAAAAHPAAELVS
ncbi:MAG TPA: polymer-forming cytoskeletal protein [Bryobacteraceae bacterium]|jgi:cytoskeletal protein CcmA (bactofilin family)|nr:polymer-forming cytoskeletal protein [Bryobacteraceae bacterium]